MNTCFGTCTSRAIHLETSTDQQTLWDIKVDPSQNGQIAPGRTELDADGSSSSLAIHSAAFISLLFFEGSQMAHISQSVPPSCHSLASSVTMSLHPCWTAHLTMGSPGTKHVSHKHNHLHGPFFSGCIYLCAGFRRHEASAQRCVRPEIHAHSQSGQVRSC